MNFSALQQNRIVYAMSIQVFHRKGWVIKQLFMPVCSIVKLLPLGTVDDLMHYCTRPLASCNSALGRLRHLGAIVWTILHVQTGMK